MDGNRFKPSLEIFEAGKPDQPVPLATELDELMLLVAERNPDFYQWKDERLSRA